MKNKMEYKYDVTQDSKTREQNLRNGYILYGFEKMKAKLMEVSEDDRYKGTIRQDMVLLNREKYNNQK